MEDHMVTVGNLMRTEPVTVEVGTSVVEAARLMRECNVESVLIARKAQIIGIVTESDIVKKFVGAEKAPYFVPVEEIMSSPVPGIEERRPLTEAADLMDKHHTLHLGVTKGGALIGLVSVRDFLRPVSIDDF
jgi:CBS domain-containing protein